MRILGVLVTLLLLSLFATSADARGHGGGRGRAVVMRHHNNNFFGFPFNGFFVRSAVPVPGNQIVPPLVSPIQPTFGSSVLIVADGRGGFATQTISNSGGTFRFVNDSMVATNADPASQVVVERHGGHESHAKMIVFGNDRGTNFAGGG